jgi:hypothetical protein
LLEQERRRLHARRNIEAELIQATLRSAKLRGGFAPGSAGRNVKQNRVAMRLARAH